MISILSATPTDCLKKKYASQFVFLWKQFFSAISIFISARILVSATNSRLWSFIALLVWVVLILVIEFYGNNVFFGWIGVAIQGFETVLLPWRGIWSRTCCQCSLILLLFTPDILPECCYVQTKIVCNFKALTSITLKPVTEVVKFVTGTQSWEQNRVTRNVAVHFMAVYCSFCNFLGIFYFFECFERLSNSVHEFHVRTACMHEDTNHGPSELRTSNIVWFRVFMASSELNFVILIRADDSLVVLRFMWEMKRLCVRRARSDKTAASHVT